jgi:pimeloyl-ACP methyl ester carboxylesterase
MGLLPPTRTDFIDDRDGWDLEVRYYSDPERKIPGRPPVVMIPGYAMNTHILAFHPRGASLVEHMVAAGFDVWTANLRGQGGSRRTGPRARFGLAELALVDIPAVLAHVRHRSGFERVDVIGCSLGGSLLFAYLAHHRADHGVRRLISMGGPLTLTHTNPLLKALFASGRLAGWVPIKGTRRLAGVGLPLLRRIPSVLSLYMNADGIDLSRVDPLVQTVDDPVRRVNRQIARWLRAGELRVRGVDVAAALRDVHDVAVLAVIANRDGIVPPGDARSIADVVEGATVLEVGTPDRWYAHADLFIGNTAAEDVFTPLERWLSE